MINVPLGEMPKDPFELARLRADEASATVDHSLADERLLSELDYAADRLGFIGESFLVEAHRSIIAPAEWNKGERVRYVDFYGLLFEGEMACFSKITIGKILGHHAVNALCVSFHRATLLPYFDNLQAGDLLHVPVLAVASIEQVAD